MSHLLSDLFHGTIRTLGFFTKEIVTVLRQPRLIASLVLGPFVILLLFGLGFRGQHPEFRTTLVVPNDPSISDDPRVYQQSFSGVFQLQQVTRDENRARAEVVRQSKGPAAQALELTGQTRAETDALDADLRSGNYADAAARTGRLLVATRAAREGLAKALDALGEVGSGPATTGPGQADSLLGATEQELAGLQSDLAQGPAGLASAERRVRNIRTSNQ